MGRPRPLWASISHGAHKASMGKHGFGRTRAFHDGKSAESHSCQAQRDDTSNAPVRLAFRRFNLLVTQGTLNSPPFHHFHAASHKPLVTLKGPSWQGGASTWRLSIASSSPALKAKSENPEQTGATGPTTLALSFGPEVKVVILQRQEKQSPEIGRGVFMLHTSPPLL